nr:uncharacterized protein LOC109157428 [Ipomoea batatas]
MLKVYNTRGRPAASNTQSGDDESFVGVMADPTLDGADSNVFFSQHMTSPSYFITISSPPHAPLLERQVNLSPALSLHLASTNPMTLCSREATARRLPALGHSAPIFPIILTSYAAGPLCKPSGFNNAYRKLRGTMPIRREHSACSPRACPPNLARRTQTTTGCTHSGFGECHRRLAGHTCQVLQEWAVTSGGKAAMGLVAEVWLRDTDEEHARIVRKCEAAFYMGQRDMQD